MRGSHFWSPEDNDNDEILTIRSGRSSESCHSKDRVINHHEDSAVESDIGVAVDEDVASTFPLRRYGAKTK